MHIYIGRTYGSFTYLFFFISNGLKSVATKLAEATHLLKGFIGLVSAH